MANIDDRRFPILGGGAVPWSVVEAHAESARLNHFQSLEQLAARGGLGPIELLHVLLDVVYSTSEDSRQLQRMTDRTARERIAEVVIVGAAA